MLVALVVMLLAFWLMSHFARKQQQKMQAEQERRTEEAMVPGTWVRTRAGFYGTVVEIDGDVVTLATSLGDESLWAKSAIVGAEEPPFAYTAAEGDAAALDTVEEVDAADAEVLPADDPVAPEHEDGSEPRP